MERIETTVDEAIRTQQPATAADFKKASPRAGRLVELPSGNFVKVRLPGIEAFLRKGMIPNTLLPLVQQALSGKVESAEKAAVEVFSDPTKLEQLFELYDTVTIECMVDPVVLPIPKSETERKEDALYVDEILMEDKTYIWNLAIGGVKDLETFRKEQARVVESLQSGEGVEQAPE